MCAMWLNRPEDVDPSRAKEIRNPINEHLYSEVPLGGASILVSGYLNDLKGIKLAQRRCPCRMTKPTVSSLRSSRAGVASVVAYFVTGVWASKQKTAAGKRVVTK